MNKSNEEILADNRNEVIESDLHTLFIKEMPDEMIPLYDENGNVLEGLWQKLSSFTSYSLFLGEFLDETNHGFNKILNELQNRKEGDELKLHISSNGGYVHEGMVLFNIVSSLFPNATTYLNYGYSMGALVFLFGKERVIYENSSLMIHNWSGGFYGKSYDIEAQLEHVKKKNWKFFSKIINPYLTKKEIKNIKKGGDEWFDARKMLKRGIATSIMIDGEVLTAKEYLKGKKNKPLKKA